MPKPYIFSFEIKMCSIPMPQQEFVAWHHEHDKQPSLREHIIKMHYMCHQNVADQNKFSYPYEIRQNCMNYRLNLKKGQRFDLFDHF